MSGKVWSMTLMLLCVPLVQAQDSLTRPVSAPVPAPIVSAKRVFVANGGTDAMSLTAFKKDGDSNAPYNWFYSALKSWGRYELVSTPSEADLVMEVRFDAPLKDCGKITLYTPQLTINIIDAKTHFLLWSVTEETQGAVRKSTWEKNFNETVATVINDLKQIAGAGTP